LTPHFNLCQVNGRTIERIADPTPTIAERARIATMQAAANTARVANNELPRELCFRPSRANPTRIGIATAKELARRLSLLKMARILSPLKC
jgi:hypothetical protein